MSIQVYNSLTKQKESFTTIEPHKVRYYVCGVTVYDYCHLGHARAYVAFDVIKRYLTFKGYEVNHVQNFTDIDDKIIARAAREKIPYDQLTSTFIDAYFEDMQHLNVLHANRYPRAVEYVDQMIALVETLIEKGHAYPVENGSVYFSVSTSPDYGKLSRKVLEDLEAGHRVDIEEGKKDPFDFALWKASKPGEPAWQSPWGMGRPGWHIECSAMSMTELGEELDVHGGGQDLIFPHHENEICQSECATGKSFARYWFHNGFVTINEEKMSKSLDNFFTIRDVLKAFSGEVIRFFLMKIHYRHPVNFSEEGLIEARTALERLHNTILNNRDNQAIDPAHAQAFNDIEQRFYAAMDDDFNTAEAIGILFDLSKLVNTTQSGAELFERLGALIGLFYTIQHQDDALPADVEALIQARTEAKQNKDYAKSDALRDQLLNEHNIVLEDTADGVKWKRV